MRLNRIIASIMLAVTAVVLGGLGWFGYDAFMAGFSAKAEPSVLEISLARHVRRVAIPREQREMPNPVPAGPEVMAQARAHFADHCASCHANNGSGDTPIGRCLYPKAPDLRLPDTQKLSDGELVFIIHHGIRFTGMPAWGTGTLEDDLDSWKLVHFIRRLPHLTPAELEEMQALNPKSPHQREEEAAFDRFLQGDDAAASPVHDHH